MFAITYTIYTDGERSRLECSQPGTPAAQVVRHAKQAMNPTKADADRKRAGKIMTDAAAGLGFFGHLQAYRALEMFLDLIPRRKWEEHFEPGEPSHDPDQCAVCLAIEALKEAGQHYQRPEIRKADQERAEREADPFERKAGQ